MSLIIRRFLNKTILQQRFITQTPKLQQEMPDPLQLCTGLQRKEIEAYMEGNCDPYHMKVLKRGCGTKENPTLIPSAFNGRIVGCICKDNRFVNYMWLERDCPKRCECGHWYRLQEVERFS
ncbi:cytochrome c oxidase subunit 5B, mitochondrial-like [Calliphora vicina]|uniref:cytochrome c oxidase subunit 5B, mitochondrial-like n=1 Tax=Calliphora vicina TaxID=7373 RepID=UPI00325A5AD8